MKKKAIRFFPLMLAVILLVPLLSQPGFAADQEVADYQGTPIFSLGLENSQWGYAGALRHRGHLALSGQR